MPFQPVLPPDQSSVNYHQQQQQPLPPQQQPQQQQQNNFQYQPQQLQQQAPPPAALYQRPMPNQQQQHHAAAAAGGMMSPGFNQGLNAIGKIGAFYGQQFYEEKARGWFSFFSLDKLRYYFHVNNKYVVNKIKIILFPFVHKNWKRLELDVQSQAQGIRTIGYKYPKDDINAPDLYIPLMSFITYILLYGLALGIHHRFNPEILGLTASSAFVILIFEVIVMKLGFYLLGDQIQKPPLLDLISYSSYKYVGCIVALGFGIVFGSNAHLLANICTSMMMAIYMMRTIKRATAPKTTQLTETSKRNYFLLILGGLQMFTCWILGRGAIPSETALVQT